MALAGRVWAATPTDQPLAWHHLVLAVGNFKRQPGRRLHPSPLLTGSPPRTDPPTSLAVPGFDRALHRDETASWELLGNGLRGAGVATTTTLLAALWPEHHFVFDWRVHDVTNGLRVQVDLPVCPGVTAENNTGHPLGYDCYRRVREWLTGTSTDLDVALVSIARALYEISRKVGGTPGRTWAEYGTAAIHALTGRPHPRE